MNFPDKLKKEYRERLLSLEGYSFDKSLFIDEFVISAMVDITEGTGYEVAVLISRKGQVLDACVGERHSVAVDVEENRGRYTGSRLIHTHPNGNVNLSGMDISLLKNKKLDCLCAISIKDGLAYSAQIGYLTGKDVDIVNCHDARYLNKYGLLDKIISSEKEYKEYYAKLNELPEQRAILVKVAIKEKGDMEADLDELESLAKTAGIVTVDRISQFRVKPDSKYYIGTGKIDVIRESIQFNEANLVIFDNELSGSKVSSISAALCTKVIDRSMLILDIFAGRARTNEGKLQVELAQLKYSLPRLNALSESSGRFGGGVGMRGPGETKLELNRRIVENNILKKSEELKKLKKHRELNRKSRQANSKPVVAIVGYTNSGKSTLLNLLARTNVYVKDELFATLDTTTRNVWLGEGKEALFTDTVGFINNLPHEFIEAFASTLEESIYADLILHVVDISNPNHKNHIKVTNEVLKSLGCDSPVIMVYNKCDNLKDKDIELDGVLISAKSNIGIDTLKDKISKTLFDK